MTQVQWDEVASIPRPDRVSPWEIEPFVASAPEPAMIKNKRPRPPNENLSLGKILFFRLFIGNLINIYFLLDASRFCL